MLIGGLQKTSLLDFPGRVAAIVFTPGCDFRCSFCYNASLVTNINPRLNIVEKVFFNFLDKRKKVLDAVVISGGEPTLQADLLEFMSKIKKRGFLIKLDTNGSRPEIIQKILGLNLVDYLAMDIKAPLSKYATTVKMPNLNKENIKKSIKLIMASGLPYEFRSTLLPVLHTKDDVVAMAKLIKGAAKYYLQKFVPMSDLIDKSFKKEKSYTTGEMKELAELCKKYVKECLVR